MERRREARGWVSRIQDICLGLAFLGALTSHVNAQEMAIPVGTQVELIVKILSFDRSLKPALGGKIVMGVLYQSKLRSSTDAMEEVVGTSTELPADGFDSSRIQCVPLELTSMTDLERELDLNQIDVLYLTPMRAVEISSILRVTASRRILTLTGVPDYVEEGVSVGIGIRGDRPLIMVNLQSTKREGADFNSHLLKLAKIVPGGRQ